MNYFVYNLVTTAAIPPAAAWLAVNPRLRPLLARLSPKIETDRPDPIWVHACSVGELSVARPIVKALRARYRDVPIVLTVSTISAWDMATKDPPEADLAWFPYDQSYVVSRFFERLQPRALLLVETELWPLVLREAHRRGVPSIVVNARLSDKHFQRYQNHARTFRSVFGHITAVAAQHPVYADRFDVLGVERQRITVTGNIKFDNVRTEINAQRLHDLRAECALSDADPIIVFGSSRPGDEALVAACWQTWKTAYPNARLIVALRHRDRLAEAVAEFKDPVLLRSGIAAGKRPANERVLVVDTLGELVDFYALATVAIVGGSFYPGVNGHNPLESAALGVPTVFGPYMSNFMEPAETLTNSNGAVAVEAKQLERAVTALLDDPARRATIASTARAAILQNQGALDRTLDVVDSIVLTSGRAP